MTRVVDPVLEEIRHQVLRMGNASEAILEKAVRALFRGDAAAAAEVQGDDLEIDRLDVEIDEAVLRALALQSPVADDLRQVVAAKMIATDLERVGDLARNVAKSAIRLADRPDVEPPLRLRELADEARSLLRAALDAYSDLDVAKAEAVLDEDDQVDQDEDRVIRAAIRELAAHPEHAAQGVDFILVAKNLERVADHATNIAEGVILAAQARNVKHAQKLADAGMGPPNAR